MAKKSAVSRFIADIPRQRNLRIRLDHAGLISRASLFFADKKDAQARLPSEASLVLRQLSEIVDLARGLSKTRGPLFEVVPMKHAAEIGLSRVKNPFIKFALTNAGDEIGLFDCTGELGYGALFRRCLQTKLEVAMKYLPHHAFHPVFEVIKRHFGPLLHYREDILADQIKDDLYTYANEVNRAVELIRADLLSIGFRKESGNFIRAANDNFQTLESYVATLFGKRATLWVIRLDLGYTIHKDYEEVRKHRESFLDDLRKRSPVGRPFGLSWKLEYSHQGSWRHHFLLFFTPMLNATPEQIGDRLGEHWLSTTTMNAQIRHSDGAFLNCNAINRRAARSYAVRRFGTGTITRKQLELPASDINKAIQYMTQLDYHIKLRPQRGMKTFFGGNKTAAEQKESTGRPRKPRQNLGDQLSELSLRLAMPGYQEE